NQINLKVEMHQPLSNQNDNNGGGSRKVSTRSRNPPQPFPGILLGNPTSFMVNDHESNVYDALNYASIRQENKKLNDQMISQALLTTLITSGDELEDDMVNTIKQLYHSFNQPSKSISDRLNTVD